MVLLTLWLCYVHVGGRVVAGASAGDRRGARPAMDPAGAGAPARGSSARALAWTGAPGEADPEDPFVRAKLSAIGPGVDKAFTFVRDQVGFEAYTGSLRGARGTLWSGAGNSLDQASLLLALLRAQGVRARYARGTLAEKDARILIRSLFDPVVAAHAVGYIPERFPRYEPENDAGLLREVADHWWVELEGGTALDPSFSDHAVGQTRGVKTGDFDAIPEELRHSVVVRLKAELHNPLSQYSYQIPLEVVLNTADVYGRALTLGHFVNTYQAPALVTGWKTYTYSPYLLVDDNDADWTNDHLIRGTDYQEFLTGLFPLANSILTRLTLEFEVRDPGRAPDIRTRDLLDRVGYAARKGLAQPGPVDTTRPALTECDVACVHMLPGWYLPSAVVREADSLTNLQAQVRALEPLVAALAARDPAHLTPAEQATLQPYARLLPPLQAANAQFLNAAFLIDADHWIRINEPRYLVRAWFDSPRLILTQMRVRAGTGAAETRGVLSLDIRKDNMAVVPYPGQNDRVGFSFNMARGLDVSLVEDLLFQRLVNADALVQGVKPSAVAVFQAAKAQGVPIEVLQGAGDIVRLEGLDLTPEAKARMATALQAHQAVNVPARMVTLNGQPAIAWYELDARTGQLHSVTEDGGRQSSVEFVLISALVLFAGAFGLVHFGNCIASCFRSAEVDRIKNSPSLAVTGTSTYEHTGLNMMPAAGLTCGYVEHNDGSVDLTFPNGESINVSAAVFDGFSRTIQTTDGTGSVVRWQGMRKEITQWLNPGPSPFAGTVSVADDFTLETIAEPAIEVAHGENSVPSAYRLAVANLGLPDPGNLSAYVARTNETLFFRVKGAREGTIWGTDRYTSTSPLATAAVHAGVLTHGQTGTVKVHMLLPGGVHPGSTRNGVTSRSYTGVPAGDYRVEAVDLAADATGFRLSGTVPVGWALLFSRTNVVVPPGVTGQFSVFLQPDDAAPLPPPGTTVPFEIEVAPLTAPAAAEVGSRTWASDGTAPGGAAGDRRLHGPSARQAMTFTVPEVCGLRMESDPELLATTPDGSVALQVSFQNTGNVPLQADLSPSLPPGFALEGLLRSVSLAPGEQTKLAMTLRARGVVVNTDHVVSLTASFGPDRAQKRRVAPRVVVAVPGALQALQAASEAQALGRDGLAATLEGIGKGLSQLYRSPADAAWRGRVLANLDALGRQLDDPLLALFGPGLTAARQALAGSAPDQVTAALEGVGVELRRFAEFMTLLARHDFEVALQPNTADTLPETATRFGLYLKNCGRQTTTYDLSLDGVPAEISGGLTQSSITLLPGQATSPTLSGSEHVSVTLTQRAGQLLAFPFSLTVKARPAPAITRTATGVFTARNELVNVLEVRATPAFIEPRWERTSVGVFTGGDAGEGLDLDGDFLHAVNVGGNAVGRIRDADFTSPNVAGVTLTAVWAGNHAREFGDSDNDNRLETVMLSDRYGNPANPMVLELGRLVSGQPYKLQLLFAEDWTPHRGFDVLVDGQVITDDFNPGGVQGGVSTRDRAVVLTHEFIAAASTVLIRLDGSRVAGFSNRDPLLCGFTLEAQRPEPVEVSARILNAVNADRVALARLTVKAPDGSLVREAPPEPVALSTRSSLDPFKVGRFDPTGLAPGLYRLDLTLSETDGRALGGAQGHGPFLVGTPLVAGLSVDPSQLSPGTGEVEVTLSITNRLGLGTDGLSLVALRDTPGRAQSLTLARGHIYVGGSESAESLDVTNPWNLRLVGTLATNESATALAGDHLLVRRGFGLDVFALTEPSSPTRLGGCDAGFIGSTFPVHFFTQGDFAFNQALIFGYGAVAINFVRGDLAAYDLRNPAAPVPLGLLLHTEHADFPEFVGSDYFIGQPAAKDGVVLLPSTTGSNAATTGNGRLILVDSRTAGRLTVAGDFTVPGTRVLTSIALAGNRALVLGNTAGFAVRNNAPVLLGDVTATVLDVSDPLQPVLVGPTQTLGGIDQAVRWQMHAVAGPDRQFFLTDITRDGRPELWLLDAGDPGALRTTALEVPAPVKAAWYQAGLLYTASQAGVAVYDASGWAGRPALAEVSLPKSGVALVTGSFSLPPDELLAGDEWDTARWHFDLGAWSRSRTITWRERVADLRPGTSRDVIAGGSVTFSAWGTDASVTLPARSVACPNLLRLTPAAQTVPPGGEAVYTLSLINPAGEAAHFTLSADGLPSGWLTLPATVSVPAWGEQSVALVVRSDRAAPLGSPGFRVAAAAAGGLQDSVEGTLTLAGSPERRDDAHGVVIALATAEAAAGQGTPAFVDVRLTNTGNVTEVFELGVQLPPDIAWGEGPLSLDVPPGFENYREARLTLTPAPGTAAGPRTFAVTARSVHDPGLQATAMGTLTVLPAGVVMSLTPARGLLGAPFVLHLSNPGPTAQSYDLTLGGPLAAAARLGQPGVTLEAGATTTVPVMFTATDFAYPGEFPLLAGARAQADGRVQGWTAATVEVRETHGLAAWFDPELTGLLGPGEAAALLELRNTGNVEEACELRIVGVEGPVTAGFVGWDGQSTQAIPTLRLPGLAGGGVVLRARLTATEPGRVRVRLTAHSDPGRSVEAVAHFLPGVWLSIERLERAGAREVRLSFTPLPGYQHTIESREGLGWGELWQGLPGGPHDQGEAVDPLGAAPRFYRVRIDRP